MTRRDTYSILGWLAMVSVPIAPAFFFGHAMYTAAFNLTDTDWLSITVGVVSAAGLELVGILSGHAAVKFWRLGDDIKAAICGVILVAYVLLGISGLQGWLVKGVVMFLIAPLVYLLVALQESAGVAENTQETIENRNLAQEAEETEFKRKVQLAQMRLKHEERLARIQARASTMPAQSKLEPAEASYECEDCGQPFSTVQALNAHSRWCKARKPELSNGRTRKGESS